MNIPVVVVATFYSGMPPEQIETDITSRFERFFTLAQRHRPHRIASLPGVSVIKVYFQPGTNPDASLMRTLQSGDGQIAPSARRARCRRVVLKFDASSLPVCLVTRERRRPDRDRPARTGAILQSATRWRGVPAPRCRRRLAARYRQIMVYVDPLKLEAHQLSPWTSCAPSTMPT